MIIIKIVFLKTSVDNWWAENYSQPPLVSIEVDKAETCKKMVVNGLGYAILPSMLLDDAAEIYRYTLKTKDQVPLTRSTWMFYHEDSLKINIVKAFIEFIQNLDLKDVH